MIGDILLVEDSEADAELILRALRHWNRVNTITTVSGGVEAIEFLFSEGAYSHRTGGLPTLILLDLHMPKMNGLELLQMIKAERLTKLIPVIILASSADQYELKEAHGLGATAHLVKPVTLSAFKKAIAQVGLS